MSPPRHLAFIPDGNRRWARARGLPVGAGHAAGIENVGVLVAAAWEAGVETVTFWWGSPANLTQRAPDEVATIVGVLEAWLADGGAALLARYGADFEALGRWAELCPSLMAGVTAARAGATPGAARKLVLLMAYDGRDEIRAAAAALHGGGPDAATFSRALWTGHLPPVDLVVRTGGEPHLSAGFLLWQIAEARLAFLAEPWPACTPAALHEVLADYGSGERRFGR